MFPSTLSIYVVLGLITSSIAAPLFVRELNILALLTSTVEEAAPTYIAQPVLQVRAEEPESSPKAHTLHTPEAVQKIQARAESKLASETPSIVLVGGSKNTCKRSVPTVGVDDLSQDPGLSLENNHDSC